MESFLQESHLRKLTRWKKWLSPRILASAAALRHPARASFDTSWPKIPCRTPTELREVSCTGFLFQAILSLMSNQHL